MFMLFDLVHSLYPLLIDSRAKGSQCRMPSDRKNVGVQRGNCGLFMAGPTSITHWGRSILLSSPLAQGVSTCSMIKSPYILADKG